MDPNEILTLLRQRPFEPFRIHVLDGRTYDITHPELCLVTRRTLHIGVPPSSTGPAQRAELVAVLHVSRIEPLAGASTS